jgi:predicted DCC family thiol-disulfide oxidoreductase YuxK
MMPVPEEAKGDVWYVYDGECPLCRMAARALRIREAVGKLHLINAREDTLHPVIQEINARGLDIDKGTVIKFGGNLYHGGDAMVMMALLGSNSGWFNRLNATLFKSPIFARLCYPTIRGGRNLLLWFKGVGQIHNLGRHDG